MQMKRTKTARTSILFLESWVTACNFGYPPLTVVDFAELRKRFLELLDFRTVESVLHGAKWSKRAARFSLFSHDYAHHNDICHAERSSFSCSELIANPYMSYVLRDDLSDFVDTAGLLKQIKMHRSAKEETAKPKEAILVTGSEYRLPFHVDGCETLLIAIRGWRKLHILLNFPDLLAKVPTKLHCQSYIPAAYEPYAEASVHILSDGEGIVIPPLIPHAVDVAGDKATLAYTAYVDIPHIKSAIDISELRWGVDPWLCNL